MYHKIRIAVASLVVVTVCMLSSATTLSYFTDSDTQTNSFAVGNISTSLAIFSDVDSTPWREFDEADYGTLSPNTEYNIPYYLQATNDGNVAVYQRFRVVIPSALADYVELTLPNINNCDVKTALNNKCSNGDYTIEYKNSVIVGDVNPVTYAEYYIVREAPLATGDATNTDGWQVAGIKINFPSEDYINMFTCENNDSNNCTLGIRAYSDAIQVAGFDNAEEAFDEFRETY